MLFLVLTSMVALCPCRYATEEIVQGHEKGKSEHYLPYLDMTVSNFTEIGKSPLNIADHHEVSINASETLKGLLAQFETAGYDPHVRPHLGGRPVIASCTIHVLSLTSISEPDMDYTIDFYFRQSWDDYRLQWICDSPGKEAVSIPGDNIDYVWRPDTFFPNAKFGHMHEVTRHNAFARLLPHGHVRTSTRITLTVYCAMDLSHFPMDRQKCSLYVESFAYPIREIIYSWTEPGKTFCPVDSVVFSAGASSFTDFAIKGFRVYETFSIRPDGYNHSRLGVDVYFSRNLGYYIIQVYVPAILMVITSWVAFWLPRNSSPARVTLGVTSVLTVATLSGQNFNSLPKISYLKAVDVYLLFCFAIVFLSLMEFSLVSYATRHSKRRRRVVITENDPMDDIDPDAYIVVPNSLSSARHIVFSQLDIGDQKDIRYLAISSRVEIASRVAFPFIFILFNILYWHHYLYFHNDEEDDPGYVALAGFDE